MLDAYIYDGIRSPFGRHGGCLAALRPDDLMAQVIRALMARSDLPAAKIEDVVIGNVCQSGEDSRNIARFSALLAGLPETAGAQTVNRLCGSSMSAALDIARAVTLGDGDLSIAGGVESMTRAPFVMAKSAAAWSRQSEIYDATAGKPFPNPAFGTALGTDTMPQTADNLAIEYDLARESCDAYAIESQRRCEAARADGFFEDEITAIEITGRKGLGNPRARILAGAVSGVAPRIMGIGPAHAILKALDRAGLTLADMDVIEIDEAFAAQILACCAALKIDPEDPRLNPNGRAIAVGHPLGASGARVILTGLRQLERSGGRYAALSLCIGFGQGIAMIIERLD